MRGIAGTGKKLLTLAVIIATDKDALVCDLAETYHVLDYRSLPARLVATLTAGLSDNSRTKKKLSGAQCSVETMLLALIADKLSYLVWFQTEDAIKNKNRPDSIYLSLAGTQGQKSDGDVTTFETGDEFEAVWKKITGGE